MIRVYTEKKLVNYTQEQIILFGLLENLNEHNERIYNNVIETCRKAFEYVDDISNAEIVVMPYKLQRADDDVFKQLFLQCMKLSLPLYVFYSETNDKPILSQNLTLKMYRISCYASQKRLFEHIMPTFSPDTYDNTYRKDLTIGYCGNRYNGKDHYLTILENSKLNTNFVTYENENYKEKVKKSYMQNIKNNLFTFCYRGKGNFCSTYYDVMMLGRIPIFINTDCAFPFEDKFNINETGIMIDETYLNKQSINELVKIIDHYYEINKFRLNEIQEHNRLLWETYLSPVGFINTFSEDIKKY